jgi:hypothetical protein
MVATPGDYTWSSYRSNALGEEDALLSAQADHLALGRSVGLSRGGRPKKPVEEDRAASRSFAKQLPLEGVGGM